MAMLLHSLIKVRLKQLQISSEQVIFSKELLLALMLRKIFYLFMVARVIDGGALVVIRLQCGYFILQVVHYCKNNRKSMNTTENKEY